MEFVIRPMKPEDLNRVALILWRTTLQSYCGLVDEEHLAPATPERAGDCWTRPWL